MWKEAVVAYLGYYGANCLDELRKPTGKDSRFAG
jgi:hypothetical protein